MARIEPEKHMAAAEWVWCCRDRLMEQSDIGKEDALLLARELWGRQRCQEISPETAAQFIVHESNGPGLGDELEP